MQRMSWRISHADYWACLPQLFAGTNPNCVCVASFCRISHLNAPPLVSLKCKCCKAFRFGWLFLPLFVFCPINNIPCKQNRTQILPKVQFLLWSPYLIIRLRNCKITVSTMSDELFIYRQVRRTHSMRSNNAGWMQNWRPPIAAVRSNFAIHVLRSLLDFLINHWRSEPLSGQKTLLA